MPRLSRRSASDDTATLDPTADTGGEEKQYAKPSSGWDAFKSTRAASGGGGGIQKEDWWKPSEDESLVKFLDDEPFAAYFDVWVPAKNRSYSTLNADNPLSTKMELRPSPRAVFNILVFEPTGEPKDGVVPGRWESRVLRAAVTLGDKIRAMHEHERHGPIDKHFWEITAAGTKKNYTVNMVPVKVDDLLEEWGVRPPTDEEFAAAEESKRTRQDIYIHDDAALSEVVKELLV